MENSAEDGRKNGEASCIMDHPALEHLTRREDRSRASSMSMMASESPASCHRICSDWTGKQRLVVCGWALLDFCGFACLSVMGPFFPTEADKKGVSRIVTGLIFSCYAFTAFIFAPIWGKLVPRLGPKLVLMAGGVITGIACIGFGFLGWISDPTIFVTSCFLVRMVEAIGFAAFNTAVFTTVAKMFHDTIGTVIAAVEIAIGAGLTIGPIIGSAMFAAAGYVAPFLALGLLLLVTVIFVYFAIPSATEMFPHRAGEDEQQELRSLWTVLTSYSGILVCVAIASNSMGISFLIPILSSHLGLIGLGEDKVDLMFMCHLGMYTICAPFSGNLCDRYPRKRFLLMGAGLVIFALGHSFVGPSPIFRAAAESTLATNIIGLFVIGFGSALVIVPTYPAMIACAIDLGFPDDVRTYALMGGLWNSACALGDMLGPTLAATINEAYGFEVATSICGAILLIVGILVLAYHINAQRSTLSSPPHRVDKRLAKCEEESEWLLSGHHHGTDAAVNKQLRGTVLVPNLSITKRIKA